MATNINGGTGIDKVQDAVVTDGKLNLSPNSQPIKDVLNAGGSAPIYACRAWVNFNGTGAVAIRASENVSSITDSGTGQYTVNFTTAMPDANYSTTVATDGSGSGSIPYCGARYYTVSSVQITTTNQSVFTDNSIVCASIVR